MLYYRRSRLVWDRARVNQLLVHGVPRKKGCPGGLMGPGPRWSESLAAICGRMGQADSFLSHIPETVWLTFGTVANASGTECPGRLENFC